MSDRTPRRGLTEYREAYLKMRSVLYDRTTGLPALPLMFDRLRTLLDERRQVGVLHVEVADLELVESLYGWQVFDDVVARVARALRDCLGPVLPPSSLVAVNGVAGDRFVVFVPDAPEGATLEAAWLARASREVARRLEQAFDDEALVGLNPGVCFRIGHALLSENPFFRFERCVYAAVAAASGTHERVERRRERSWGEELRSIIRRGSVRTLFQPVVDLSSGDVVGHEALSRGPRDSLFETPAAMFALSDRVGVSAELDRLCCSSALSAAADLDPCGKLFLNMRPESLDADAEAAEPLAETLDRRGLDPSGLVLEVSERGAGADPVPFVERVRRFKEQGFEVAIDDVGTGRVGLRAIAEAEPDFLKVDVSLVRNLHRSLVQQEVVATLVELAERIGGSVIGEGVENRDEADALTRGGARYGQGHHFALPATARALRPAGS